MQRTSRAPAGHLALTHDEYWVRDSNTTIDPAGGRLQFPASPTTGYVIVNLTVDLLYSFLNPRIRVAGAAQ